MVVGLSLGSTFRRGLLVTHDGVDEPEEATNFKFTRWDDVAEPLGLTIDTVAGDPRRLARVARCPRRIPPVAHAAASQAISCQRVSSMGSASTLSATASHASTCGVRKWSFR
jgi:hypothetical protein